MNRVFLDIVKTYYGEVKAYSSKVMSAEGRVLSEIRMSIANDGAVIVEDKALKIGDLPIIILEVEHLRNLTRVIGEAVGRAK